MRFGALCTTLLLATAVLASSVQKIAKPNFQGAVKFTLSGHLPDQPPDAPDVTFLLPKGSTHGVDPNIFVGPKGAFVSVIVERVGAAAKSIFSGRSKASESEVRGQEVSGSSWIGEYEERMLHDHIRRARLYSLYSPSLIYTMMVSWHDGDARARNEAIAMAQDVIRSLKKK